MLRLKFGGFYYPDSSVFISLIFQRHSRKILFLNAPSFRKCLYTGVFFVLFLRKMFTLLSLLILLLFRECVLECTRKMSSVFEPKPVSGTLWWCLQRTNTHQTPQHGWANDSSFCLPSLPVSLSSLSVCPSICLSVCPGDITQKGYEKKRSKLLAPYIPQIQGKADLLDIFSPKQSFSSCCSGNG